MIRLNDEQYWLYAAVDPETNELLHTQLEPTTNSVLAQQFLAELREKHDIESDLHNVCTFDIHWTVKNGRHRPELATLDVQK